MTLPTVCSLAITLANIVRVRPILSNLLASASCCTLTASRLKARLALSLSILKNSESVNGFSAILYSWFRAKNPKLCDN
jgi:hypothetical protein